MASRHEQRNKKRVPPQVERMKDDYQSPISSPGERRRLETRQHSAEGRGSAREIGEVRGARHESRAKSCSRVPSESEMSRRFQDVEGVRDRRCRSGQGRKGVEVKVVAIEGFERRDGTVEGGARDDSKDRETETETTTEPKNRDRSETRTPYGKRATPSLFGGISSWAEFPVPLDLVWTNDGFECSLLFDLVDSSKLF